MIVGYRYRMIYQAGDSAMTLDQYGFRTVVFDQEVYPISCLYSVNEPLLQPCTGRNPGLNGLAIGYRSTIDYAIRSGIRPCLIAWIHGFEAFIANSIFLTTHLRTESRNCPTQIRARKVPQKCCLSAKKSRLAIHLVLALKRAISHPHTFVHYRENTPV